ncbi:aldo/keto reductase [Shouchella clausii]|uniref:aldo/keto reductase n=1 Tax=Shouchella clausii TaxID=79880 RepID=UPI000BA7E4DB|nr:aldo/keto reductase [Shouchella clausii]MBX0317818.1 aldo/keto reductase [Shouchella clausii]MDO7282015.1 aldo/keto reductase [Shouchella clausii]MDO7302110.1 aldo/keto reductase [Shouchella clausii]PAF10708.1 oxidoreductase [Shouchella clausii]
MNKRQLGKSELYVSELGLGAMSLGTDKRRATEIIAEAADFGVNYIDTADLYDYGENEKIIGAALKGKRPDFIIATKAGNRFEKGKQGWEWDPSKQYIKEAAKASLQRLQTDYIDLYQLHGGTIDDPIDETIEAFEELKQEGLIREYGISSIRPNVIRTYVEQSSIVSIMMQYSILDRRPEEWFPYLQENGISVVARGPVAKGILSERPLHTVAAASDGYLDYSVKEIEQLRDVLMQTYGKTYSLTKVAFDYCLAHPPVAAVVAGASSIEQLRQNARSCKEKPMLQTEIDNIERITKQSQYTQHRS